MSRLGPNLVCPQCRGALAPGRPGEAAGRACRACGRSFPDVAGMPDLRLASDRYLSLDADHAHSDDTDVMGLASTYYAITDDVIDRRRDRFLQHLAGAEARGEALADRLKGRGTVLEVGCGSGGLLVATARAGVEIGYPNLYADRAAGATV